MLVNSDSSLLEFENVESGVFTLQLKNVYAEDYYLNIGFSDSSTDIYYEYHSFISSDTVSFSFTIDLAVEEKLVFNQIPGGGNRSTSKSCRVR